LSNRERQISPRIELFELIGALARRRYQAADRAYAALGLNHTEARLLRMLDNEGGAATQDALSRRLSVDRSNAGRAVKRLEQAGYVGRRKDDADNRTNLVDITPKGREAAAEVNRLSNEMARIFFGDLTEADAATIVTLLRKAL
jgi:MarR family transcriptional regulator, transcriptional regulator for hemolysin